MEEAVVLWLAIAIAILGVFFSFIFSVGGKSYNDLESGPCLSWVGLGIHGPNIIAHKAICDYKDFSIVH